MGQKRPITHGIGRQASSVAGATLSLLVGCWSPGAAAGAAGAAAMPPEVRKLLARVRQQESRIRSGRITVTRMTEYLPASEAEIRAREKDPERLEALLAFARQGPRRATMQEIVRFDNERRRLLAERSSVRGLVARQRVLFTPSLTKNYHQTRTQVRSAEAGAPWRTAITMEAFVEKPQWPPYGAYGFLRRRALEGMGQEKLTCRSLGADPETGQAVLLFAWGPGAVFQDKVWIDPRRGHSVTRIRTLEVRTGRVLQDQQARYRRFSGGIWYLDRLVTTGYQYDHRGRQRLASRERIAVVSAQLNRTLPEAAFAFVIPRGTNVQDDRVSPPLIWTEGVTTPQAAQRRQVERRKQLNLVGQPAPEFELPSLTGEQVRLSDWRGKVVVLNLFAFW
jgi:hypothetical protein